MPNSGKTKNQVGEYLMRYIIPELGNEKSQDIIDALIFAALAVAEKNKTLPEQAGLFLHALGRSIEQKKVDNDKK